MNFLMAHPNLDFVALCILILGATFLPDIARMWENRKQKRRWSIR